MHEEAFGTWGAEANADDGASVIPANVCASDIRSLDSFSIYAGA